MKEYHRENPLFSLCGLNCGLCPRFHTEGASRCPGCGGKDFHILHPSCAVITCSKKHGSIEYCSHCDSYPCDRFKNSGSVDSFITYRNVIRDMQKSSEIGIERYTAELKDKIAFLELLINNYNDGRKKNFYCIAVNLLKPEDLNSIKENIEGLDVTVPQKEKIRKIEAWFYEKAKNRDIKLKLRK